MNLQDKIMDTLLKLVEVPGIAGTEAEGLTAKKIFEITKQMPYFKSHQENLNLVKIQGDHLNRSFVSALFCSSQPSKDTIILTGHLDVVDVDEFGDLKELAFKPLELAKRITELGLTKEAIDDYESGQWLFGRGTADMKYGLALDLELLREFSARDDFSGNILFLAVPGEESNSEGMIAAVPHLLEIKQQLELNYIGMFVSECCIPYETGDVKKRIYLGTAGKVMPLFFFVGKETHVYESYTGLNPNLMASEVNRLLDLNPAFCDNHRGNMTPPPICLKQTDLKELYSVQTPLYAAAYYNILTLNLDIDNLELKLKYLTVEAFENAIALVEEKVKKYASVSNTHVEREEIKPLVLTYDELYKKVKELKGTDFDHRLEEKIEQWKIEGMDVQTIAINVMKETYANYPEKAPMIVIGFAPPYYPDKHLQENNEEDMKLLKTMESVKEYAKNNFQTEIQLDHYYMGLCDLSYSGVEKRDSLKKIASNIIGINKSYTLPIDELEQLNIPSVVFGGLGKDFHKSSERLNIPYSLQVVPKLYEHLIYELFSK